MSLARMNGHMQSYSPVWIEGASTDPQSKAELLAKTNRRRRLLHFLTFSSFHCPRTSGSKRRTKDADPDQALEPQTSVAAAHLEDPGNLEGCSKVLGSVTQVRLRGRLGDVRKHGQRVSNGPIDDQHDLPFGQHT